MVRDLKELDKYPWCGHSAILGRRKNPLIPKGSPSADRRIAFSQFRPEIEKAKRNPEDPVNPACPACPVAPADGTRVGAKHRTGVKNKSLAEKTIEDVLLHFGDTLRIARRRYRQFVKNGVDQGSRPELQGGGLIRSAGGKKAGLLGRKKEEREKGDERILGSGDFVNEALSKAGELWEKGNKSKVSLPELIDNIAAHLDLRRESILSASKRREVSKARAVISFLAVKEMGYSSSEVARELDISRISAARCAYRGEKIVNKYRHLMHIGPKSNKSTNVPYYVPYYVPV